MVHFTLFSICYTYKFWLDEFQLNILHFTTQWSNITYSSGYLLKDISWFMVFFMLINIKKMRLL